MTSTLPMRGVDVSMTEEVERLGGRFTDGGRERDLFAILADRGVTTVRLRLWVDPVDDDGVPFQGGTNDLATTRRLARRAAAHGMDVLLDLHYSDFWTDPKKQQVPRSWAHLSGSALERQVADHTAESVTTLLDDGVALWGVQVGNEITNGTLWPHGRTPHWVWEEGHFEEWEPERRAAAFDALAGLLSAGSGAVRATLPAGRVMLHLDQGGRAHMYRMWFDEIVARGVDFDVVGLSYYPYWHGTLDDLAATLDLVATRYGKDAVVVETAYAHRPDGPSDTLTIVGEAETTAVGYPATVDGQTRFLLDLRRVVGAMPDGRGLGFVYWEPAWLPVPGTTWASPAGMAYGDDVAEPGNPWANQLLFDWDGAALSSWRAFAP